MSLKREGESMSYEEKFMLKAMELSRKAYEEDEVPVGAVIVKDGKILASAFNKRGQRILLQTQTRPRLR